MAKKRKKHVVATPRLDDFVEKALASMHTYGEVVDSAMEEFGVAERTVKLAITRVRASWRDAEASTVEERRAKFRAELEYALRRALEAEDFRAVAVMARTRADVEGIRAPKKTEHSGVVGLRPVATMSPQDREREIQALIAKRAAALGPGAAPVIDTTAIETPDDPGDDVDEVPATNETTTAKKSSRKKPRVH